jgi:hypothetical protein
LVEVLVKLGEEEDTALAMEDTDWIENDINSMGEYNQTVQRCRKIAKLVYCTLKAQLMTPV